MSNQYDVLASPIEGKQQETASRSRGGKDDMKEQAYQARTQVKAKAASLKEQVVQTGVYAQATQALQQGLDLVKEKAGLSKDASNDELAEEVQDQAGEQWEQVKQRGNKQLKKAADVVDAKLDENLTKQQKAKLQQGARQAKKGAQEGVQQAQGWANRLLDMTMSAPALRPAKNWIRRNNLALPALLLLTFTALWTSISLIRLINDSMAPKVPEFDIHSKEAMMDWARYHAGDLKGQAIDARQSLTGRAAAFLANHEYEKMRARAIDYRDIGMSKLGLREPTWGEWAWAKVTGRPITWQERVESVLDLAKAGIATKATMKAGKEGLVHGIKNLLHKEQPEPTMRDRAQGIYESLRDTVYPPQEPVGIVDGLKASLRDGVDSIRSHLPGGEPIEVIKQRAYDAAHPSTIDQIKSGAEYVKNRIVHGSQEAAHIAQDRANVAADKAKYKAGL